MLTKNLEIDIRVGGLGDIWMRLVSFYVASIIRPDIKVKLIIPTKLMGSATAAFADRLLLSSSPCRPSAAYINLGLRHILPSTISGKRYVSPYGRSVIRDWNRWSPKDLLNLTAYAFADWLNLIYSPTWKSLSNYQGYSEITSLPCFRGISYTQFTEVLLNSFAGITSRMANLPLSPQFDLSHVTQGKVVVFPSGTAHQFIPLQWALSHLPNALYAFFYQDPDLQLFADAGLETISYFLEPGDILAIASSASVAITTDSFPSHVLQYSNSKLVVLLTELPRARVVAPSFKGSVVESTASCHPCPHLERRGFPKCKAGFEQCLNWSSNSYSTSIQNAIDYQLSLRPV